MRHEPVDFARIQPEHEAIDARLRNWARWAIGSNRAPCQPMFRYYVPDNYEREMADPINMLDAATVQKGVTALPMRHRLAVSWCYIVRSNPRRAAQNVGASLQGLADLIADGRQMLRNRGV